ncbi:hypothetical protein BH18ACT9_BH18ACT9_11220 [soil metagenome]
MAAAVRVEAVDAFELPDWLGTSEVIWSATSGIHDGHLVSGELRGDAARMGPLGCDLLGVDQAYPQPVVDEGWRQRAHQAWTHGQVLLAEYDGRLTLMVPGNGFTADAALEAIGRFAQAVGASPSRYLAALRL